jgi:hypothetical protein
MILEYISFRIFIISFAIGLFFVYIYGPEMKTIYIYPSPENIDKIIFQDKAENCFRYEANEIECPKDNSILSKIPLQI